MESAVDFVGLTRPQCSKALAIVEPAIQMAMFEKIVKRRQGFMVVLNPKIQREPKYKKPDAKFMEDVVLFTSHFGNPEEWDHPFDDIAISKAFISWMTGLPSRQVQLMYPYLYQEGWTKFGGSAVRPGNLIAAFSGVEEHYDEMFAALMLDAITGVCLHEMHGPDGVMAHKSITYLGEK
ncbi:MAG TPA: hypothetical protein VHA05_02670 [Candidatus Saccharimonadales bacterium]|jgi:hypothetical protein|nr:hypothetical protein [Candidatus Saccharimonadales bacterium]